ncbi:MAG: polyprenol monophosphomannose synthase [Chloroflexia bacterium]
MTGGTAVAETTGEKRMIVVLPTYNERENLPVMIEALHSLGIPGLEVLVVDDNSPDGTGQLAEDLGEQYSGKFEVHVAHRPQKMGLGPAYIDGFGRALALGADYVVEMDADFQHDPATLHEFRRWIEEYDIVVGCRYMPGGSVEDRWSIVRKLLSRGGAIYSRFVLGLQIHDPTGGFKCFRASALRAIDLSKVRSSGYTFQIEMSYAAQRAGLRVKEVPIRFVDRERGTSKMSARIAIEATWRVWQIRQRY